MVIRNLTPHEVVVLGPSGEVLRRLAPDGQVARCATSSVPSNAVDGLPVVRQSYGLVQGLPAEDGDVALVVSALVRLACPGRRDLYSPGELVRDNAGQPIGCRGLVGQ